MPIEVIAGSGRDAYRLLSGDGDGQADAAIILGGEGAKFVPNLNARKWARPDLLGGEAWLNLNFPGSIVTTERPAFDGRAVSLQIGDVLHKYYSLATGELEYEFVLLKKPSTNRLTFALDFSPGLDFYLQPALTPAEIAEGNVRPDNVVGSYAVYFSRANNQYKTGKFAHIYRPRLTDALGTQTYASLAIDPVAKTLTISVSPAWLNAAVYPVIVDPTFGYTTAGASSFGTLSTSGVRALVHTDYTYAAVSGDTITKFSVYGKTDSGTGDWGVAVYNISAGLPVTRLAAVETVTLPGTTPAWHDSGAVSQALTGGTTYCVAWDPFLTVASGGYYDTLTGNRRSRETATALPATWTHNSYDADIVSVYATVTAGGAAVPVFRYHYAQLMGN